MQSETLTYTTPETPSIIAIQPSSARLLDDIVDIQRIKNEVAMRLLQAWLMDDSGYDERVWESVKKAIEENKLSDRKRFDENIGKILL